MFDSETPATLFNSTFHLYEWFSLNQFPFNGKVGNSEGCPKLREPVLWTACLEVTWSRPSNPYSYENGLPSSGIESDSLEGTLLLPVVCQITLALEKLPLLSSLKLSLDDDIKLPVAVYLTPLFKIFKDKFLSYAQFQSNRASFGGTCEPTGVLHM